MNMFRNKKSLFFVHKFSWSNAISQRQIATNALLPENKGKQMQLPHNALLKAKNKAMQQPQSFIQEANRVSIYKVPEKLRKVELRDAYNPHFISIGPYHRGKLQDSEKFKLLTLSRVVGSGDSSSRARKEELVAALHGIEEEARASYLDEIKLSKDEFVSMMMLDGCFIVELLRELKKNNYSHSTLLSRRWMLPVVRRDLITLENQIPMEVLKIILQQTTHGNIEASGETDSLENLALRFFDPLMPREPDILDLSISRCQSYQAKHLLDLFHYSISLGDEAERGNEPHMYRSVTELKEAGIKFKVSENSQPLALRFEKDTLYIPCLQIKDHTGSFFRNIVAYEQCHQGCKPDMTTYLFFLDKLINSAEDVGLLHYHGMMQHSLGSNKQVAKLVNSLCIEVENDGQQSYLFKVVQDMNSYSSRWWSKTKAKLKHDYFTNVWVGISTFAGIVLLYLTLLQTSCDAIDASEKQFAEKDGGWAGVYSFLSNPVLFVWNHMTGIAHAMACADHPLDLCSTADLVYIVAL